jgi:Holliday junction resolvase-like predicted endonuclease
MQTEKSSRHSKITGNFSENLILYWLSKYGFECAHVDHVGIDLIARNPLSGELMGISVKSRSRSSGKKGESINIKNDNFKKAQDACKSFGCIPYFAFVVDEGESIFCYILSKTHLLKISPPKKTHCYWRMSKKRKQEYLDDPEIKTFVFEYKTQSWWDKSVD